VLSALGPSLNTPSSFTQGKEASEAYTAKRSEIKGGAKKCTKLILHPLEFDRSRWTAFQLWLSQIRAKLLVDITKDTKTI
jgi:hypothetical protein